MARRCEADAVMCGGGAILIVAALLCAVALPAVMIVAVWLGGRALSRSRGGDGLDAAGAVLHQRLASGNINVEDYYERESALRAAEPIHRRRRRRW